MNGLAVFLWTILLSPILMVLCFTMHIADDLGKCAFGCVIFSYFVLSIIRVFINQRQEEADRELDEFLSMCKTNPGKKYTIKLTAEDYKSNSEARPITTAITRATLFLSVVACIIILPDVEGVGEAVMTALLLLCIPWLIAKTCCALFLKEKRMDLLREHVEERQKYYPEMMAAMKKSDAEDAYKTIYDLTKKHALYRLHRYPPFRAWYKEWRDKEELIAYYKIKKISPERDLIYDEFYDPSAPPKSQYFKDDDEMVRSWDDELDDYGDPKPLTREDIEDAVEDALEDYGRKNKRSSVGDGLAIGIGIGIGNALTGGHGIGSGS